MRRRDWFTLERKHNVVQLKRPHNHGSISSQRIARKASWWVIKEIGQRVLILRRRIQIPWIHPHVLHQLLFHLGARQIEESQSVNGLLGEKRNKRKGRIY